MRAGILRTVCAASVVALAAGPAAAQWTFNAYEGGAIASVAEADGREFGVECVEEAEDVMRIFVVLRPRGTIRPGRTPFKFSIGRQEYSIEADLEEAAGLALVSVGVGWSGETQQEARGRLRAGSTVVVDRQAGHQGHTFSLRGSSKALNALEEACEALWAPEPEPELEPVAPPRADRRTPAADGRGAGGSAKGDARRVEAPPPVTPSPAEPPAAPSAAADMGDWRVETVGGRVLAFNDTGDGTGLGLTCAPGSEGRPDWVLKLPFGSADLIPLAVFDLFGPLNEARIEAIMIPTGPSEPITFEGAFDEEAHADILADLGIGFGRLRVVMGGGSRVLDLELAGGAEAIPELLAACGKLGG